MSKWRIDEILTRIHEQLGPFWLTAALVVVLYALFGRLVRSLLVSLFVLVCTQVWWIPLNRFAYHLRWFLLLVLVVRGAAFVMRSRTPPDEEQLPRRVMVALGSLAVMSVLWTDNLPAFTLELAASFCLGLFVVFGLLWRLADDPAVVHHIARGALVFGALTFGTGFLIAAYAHVADDELFLQATNLEWGARYRGVFYNPNAAGVIGAMLLPIIVASPKEYLGRFAWARVPVVLVTFATIFLSGSRSALIGSAMAIVILATYRYGAGALLTMALGGVAVAGLAFYSPLDDIDSSAVGHISRTKHLSTLSGRFELWQEGWDAAQGHLVFGQGWGKSRDVLGDVDLERAVELGQVVGATNLHNAHLQLLIDVGFTGVLLFWTFCALVLRSGWRILMAPRTPLNGLSLVIFTSALALMADTWVHGAIWSMGSPTTLAFWTVCALAIKEGARARRETLTARAAPGVSWQPAAVSPA